MTWKRLSPGVYVAPDGGLHIDAVELCAAHGYAPTQENIDTLVNACEDLPFSDLPGVRGLDVVVVDDRVPAEVRSAP
jgi:hypothetical protein